MSGLLDHPIYIMGGRLNGKTPPMSVECLELEKCTKPALAIEPVIHVHKLSPSVAVWTLAHA